MLSIAITKSRTTSIRISISACELRLLRFFRVCLLPWLFEAGTQRADHIRIMVSTILYRLTILLMVVLQCIEEWTTSVSVEIHHRKHTLHSADAISWI